MALEYTLTFNGKLNLEDHIRSYYKCSIGNNEFDLTDNEGFYIKTYFGSNNYFEFPIGDFLVEKEFVSTSHVNFRFNKEFENSIAKTKMIEFVVYLLGQFSEDCILLFLSDSLVLERLNNEIYINNEFGFWDVISVDKVFGSLKENIVENYW